MKHQNTEQIFKDHICNMEVSRLTAADEFIYQGKSYYFCARGCSQEFKSDPEKYIHHHRQHGIKPK